MAAAIATHSGGSMDKAVISKGQKIRVIGQKAWLRMPVTEMLTIIIPGKEYPYPHCYLIEPTENPGCFYAHNKWLGLEE